MNNNKIQLNLGAGKTRFPGFINIDSGNFPDIKYKDVADLPFDNNSVDVIYASHLINYFDNYEIIPILKHWKNKLKKYGKLYLAVPDFKEISFSYVYDNYETKEFIGPVCGRIKSNDKYLYHKSIYDYRSLTHLLDSISFKKIKRYDWTEIYPFNKFDDQSKAYLPHSPECIKNLKWTNKHRLISLNLECTK